MRAIEYTHNGDADVLQLVDREAREPGVGEIRVRIVESGVNPTDWKSRRGDGSGAPLPEPQVPGQDGAGVVDAVGPGITEFLPGDRVWLWEAAYQRSDGTTQELAVVPVERAVELPEGVTFDVGASIGVPALTAHRALTAREAGPTQLSRDSLRGIVVLVAGGAGAVGHAAIQLAVWAGATVVTTVSSPEKAALASAAGARHVIDYRTEDVLERLRTIAPEGADIIVEVNAVANLELDVELLAPQGTIAMYAGNPGDSPAIPLRAAMAKSARLQFLLTYVTTAEQKRAAVAAVTDALRDGVLGVGVEFGLPIIRFPLNEAADAHRAVENNATGKVLIDIAVPGDAG